MSTYLWVGNGTTQKDVYSDYDNGSPEAIPNNDQIGEVFTELLSGSTYGSRVVAVTTATELFGASVKDNQLGVGAKDTLVVVADLVEKQAVAPTPTDDKAHDASPGTQPKVVEEDGKPTGPGLLGHRRARARHPGPARRPRGGHGRGREGVRHRHRQLPRRDLRRRRAPSTRATPGRP